MGLVGGMFTRLVFLKKQFHYQVYITSNITPCTCCHNYTHPKGVATTGKIVSYSRSLSYFWSTAPGCPWKRRWPHNQSSLFLSLSPHQPLLLLGLFCLFCLRIQRTSGGIKYIHDLWCYDWAKLEETKNSAGWVCGSAVQFSVSFPPVLHLI